MLEQFFLALSDVIANGFRIPVHDPGNLEDRFAFDKPQIEHFLIQFVVDVFFDQFRDLAVRVFRAYGFLRHNPPPYNGAFSPFLTGFRSSL